LANPDEYWAVEDRRKLLEAIAGYLGSEEKAEQGRLEENHRHIENSMRDLRRANVQHGLEKLQELSSKPGIGVEGTETIGAILDDMLASIPQRSVSLQVIEQINEFSSHVEGLGITSRFIPSALIDICRELAANAPPEEVDRIESIILRVIASARTRF